MSTTQDLDCAEEAPADISLHERMNGNGNGTRYSNRAGILREPAQFMSQPAGAERDAVVNYYVFTLAATLVAVVYALTFVAWGDWDSPQLVIAVSLGLAASFLWVWKGVFGKVVALAAFGYALYGYSQWFMATSRIKGNTGRGDIPGAGPLGNFLYGGSWLDPLALLAVVVLLCLSLYFLVPDIKSLLNARAAKHEDQEEDNHGSVTTIQGASHS